MNILQGFLDTCRFIRGVPPNDTEAGAVTQHPTPIPNFLSSEALSADERDELDTHGSIERDDGTVWTLWRTDFDGAVWLRRIPEGASDG